jgi:4-hydroxy-tetrahydrodipicolinate synthase
MKALKGVIAALITPFSHSGALEPHLLMKHIDYLLEQGVHALAVGGSTGEFEALSFEELMSVYQLVVEHTQGRVPVVGGVGGRSTREAMHMAKAAQTCGLDALLVFPPHYFGYEFSEEEFFHYYHDVASATPLPVILYNSRGKTRVNLPPDLVARLSELPTIRYIKEATGDIRYVLHMLQATQNRITVLSGWNSIALESLLMGAQGIFSGTANVLPEVTITLYRLTTTHKYEEALQYYLQVRPLLVLLDEQGRFVAWLKAAMRLRGHDGGFPRRPYLPASDGEIALLKQALTRVKQSGLP